MSETTMPGRDAGEGPITLAEIRGKALRIRDEVKDEVTAQVRDRRNQLLAAGIVAIVAVVGIAYLIGSRAGRRDADLPRY